jgi:hypothetical protein
MKMGLGCNNEFSSPDPMIQSDERNWEFRYHTPAPISRGESLQ